MTSPAASDSNRDDSALGMPTAESALAWVKRSGRTQALSHDLKKLARRRTRRRNLRLATAAAALVLGLGFAWQIQSRTPLKSSTPLVSGPSQQILADGSVVKLTPDAKITFNFTTHSRRVTLLQGAAHFSVVSDTHRPFIVEANQVTARAVGTAFLVERGQDAVEVVVNQGSVAVNHATRPPTASPAPETANAPETALLTAGKRVSVTTSQASSGPLVVETLTPSDLATRLSWTVPRIEFSGRRLEDVVEVFNRYGDSRIILGEKSLGDLEVSGVLRVDSSESLIALVVMEFGLIAEPREGTDVVLRRP